MRSRDKRQHQQQHDLPIERGLSGFWRESGASGATGAEGVTPLDAPLANA